MSEALAQLTGFSYRSLKRGAHGGGGALPCTLRPLEPAHVEAPDQLVRKPAHGCRPLVELQKLGVSKRELAL